MSSKKVHYVDNSKLFEAMKSYLEDLNAAKKNNEIPPKVPNYIGECIMKISTHLAYRPNFSNYTFREEMISDGIENCLLYLHNFNPSKSQNPFAYFTQIIFFAFIRRIQKEKKYLYTKFAATEMANLNDMTSATQESDDNRYNDGIKHGEWTAEQMERFMEDFENKMKIKKTKSKRIKKVANGVNV
jgi:hypothetical protein